MNPISTHHRRESGQAIVILAFAMIVLLAFAALAIDGGNAYVERRRSQNGADAGALAGARQVWINRANLNSSETLILQEINGAAEKNGIADSNDINGDDINTNVRAYYTDKQGNLLEGGVQVGVRGSIPSNARGLKVYASRQFQTFIAGIIGRREGAAEADATAVFVPPVPCNDYAIYAAGPSNNHQSVHATGSNGQGGDNLTITDGGIYAGDGGLIQNGQIIGDGQVDIVGGCGGNCEVGGVTVNEGAEPQPAPALYDVADYTAGGQYAVFAGSEYHAYSGNKTFTGSMAPGVYFIDGDVDLKNIGASGDLQRVSIIATGDIKITGGAYLTTYDPRMPVLFSLSNNINNGAVGAHNSEIELHGFVYAPNGAVNISGASGSLYGAIYGREVKWDGASVNIVYEPAFCPPQQAKVWLLK